MTMTSSVTDQDIQAGRETISIETHGLEALAKSLDQNFSQAIALILGLKGRLIVTGMGKSGHVGSKIAATLASTGQPAFFVHPAEASHGDLGMLGREDGLLALSNSGETKELKDILAHAKRLTIPLITITSKSTSTMSLMADCSLVLPQAPEACPHDLAPTTSTTMSMALGDALAIALMRRRTFAAEEFHALHPGGRLGLQFVTIADIMHADQHIPKVTEHANVHEVVAEINAKSMGCTLVMRNNECVGIITDGDLRRHITAPLSSMTASDIMTENPIGLPFHAPAVQALALMEERSITTILVLQDQNVVGLLHIHDCLRAGLK